MIVTPFRQVGLGHSTAKLLSPSLKSASRQSRTIVHESLLNLPIDHPEPWPYKEKGYAWFHSFDSTTKRFHANSKLIVLEGNVGSGKSKIGKELADSLGMLFMPEFKMDDILIDRYGNDMRDFYHLFPKRFRIPDANLFFKDPMDDLSVPMQDRICFSRWEQYLNALAHILNTGQGVVLERSVYADFVFANAMRSKNYISPEYHRHYFYQRKMTLPALRLYPHLVIYLDCPISKSLEAIKQRGNEDEIRVHDADYLNVMKESYKDMLRELRRHSRILVYDWAKPSSVDDIVEDISNLEFDFYQWHYGDVLETWFAQKYDAHWSVLRRMITEKGMVKQAYEHVNQNEVGELYINPYDGYHWMNVMQHEVLKSPYGYGFTSKDPYQGMDIWRWIETLPNGKWTEYWFREEYLQGWDNAMRYVEHLYDPDYLHHH